MIITNDRIVKLVGPKLTGLDVRRPFLAFWSTLINNTGERRISGRWLSNFIIGSTISAKDK